MKKGNIIIQYQIDLEIYKKVRKEKYYHFSKSEIVENMLWGEVLILNDDKTLFHFQADLCMMIIIFPSEERMKRMFVSYSMDKESHCSPSKNYCIK